MKAMRRLSQSFSRNSGRKSESAKVHPGKGGGDRDEDGEWSGSEEWSGSGSEEESETQEEQDEKYIAQMQEEMKAFEEKYHVKVNRDVAASHFVHSRKFNIFIGSVVLLNAIIIGVEADFGCGRFIGVCNDAELLAWFLVESFFNVIFLVEMVMRMAADGPVGYFQDSWNRLDFVLVWISVIDAWILRVMNSQVDLKMLSVLRLLRVLRLIRMVRLMKAFRELWLVVSSMIEASRAIFWVCILLFSALYCFGILTTILIGQAPPHTFDYTWSSSPWDEKDYWGTVPKSMYSLFQIVTIDSWNSVLGRPVVNADPGFFFLFFLFLMLTKFALMNIIVGVLCEITQRSQASNVDRMQKLMDEEQKRVMNSLRAIFEAADQDGSGDVDRHEYQSAMKKRHVKEKLRLIGIPDRDMNKLFDMLDPDNSGTITIDEFLEGCARLKGVAKSKDIVKLAMEVTVYGSEVRDMAHQTDENNHILDECIERLNEMNREYFQDGAEKKKKERRASKKTGFKENMPLEDRLDTISMGTDERAVFSQVPSRVQSRPVTASGFGSRPATAGSAPGRGFPSVWPNRLERPMSAHYSSEASSGHPNRGGGVGPNGGRNIRPQSAVPHGRQAMHPMQDPRRQPLDSSQPLKYASSLEPEGEDQQPDEHSQWRVPRPPQEATLI